VAVEPTMIGRVPWTALLLCCSLADRKGSRRDQPGRGPAAHLAEALAAGAGALTVLAFAPFSLSPLALIGPALLFWLWADRSPGRAFRLGWLYGIGLMGFGVFWVRISIAQFGGVEPWLAVTIAGGLALSMALYYGLVGWVGVGLASGRRAPAMLLVFPGPVVVASGCAAGCSPVSPGSPSATRRSTRPSEASRPGSASTA